MNNALILKIGAFSTFLPLLIRQCIPVTAWQPFELRGNKQENKSMVIMERRGNKIRIPELTFHYVKSQLFLISCCLPLLPKYFLRPIYWSPAVYVLCVASGWILWNVSDANKERIPLPAMDCPCCVLC